MKNHILSNLIFNQLTTENINNNGFCKISHSYIKISGTTNYINPAKALTVTLRLHENNLDDFLEDSYIIKEKFDLNKQIAIVSENKQKSVKKI